jgi:hypothetical protein
MRDIRKGATNTRAIRKGAVAVGIDLKWAVRMRYLKVGSFARDVIVGSSARGWKAVGDVRGWKGVGNVRD